MLEEGNFVRRNPASIEGRRPGASETMIRGIYRMTPRQFRKAIDAGVFGENHVELLGGIPFVMSENPPHILASMLLQDALKALASTPRWVVNKEHRLELGKWLPLADGVVLRGPRATYGARMARADDVAVLVEISDTTYARDSGPKLRRYAHFRIPVYWIVNLNSRLVEVRTGPFGKGKKAGYAHRHTYLEGDSVPLVLDGQEVGRIAVGDLLP